MADYSLDWIKERYDMGFLKRGMRVSYDGRFGVVTSRSGKYVRIRLDGDKKPDIYHPQWEIIYYDDDGSIIADYRKEA